MRNPNQPNPNPNQPNTGAVEGEGSYTASKQYNDETSAAAADKQATKAAAREAADALDGPEAEDLERARRETAAAGK